MHLFPLCTSFFFPFLSPLPLDYVFEWSVRVCVPTETLFDRITHPRLVVIIMLSEIIARPYIINIRRHCFISLPHRSRLRSASTEQLDVPTCRRSTIGGRAFPVAGAKVWNGLPSDVTSASSLSVFKNRLKTYLFRRCYETV